MIRNRHKNPTRRELFASANAAMMAALHLRTERNRWVPFADAAAAFGLSPTMPPDAAKAYFDSVGVRYRVAAGLDVFRADVTEAEGRIYDLDT